MPKLKTCKSVAKRVKITAHGKVKLHKAGMNHILSGKSSKSKRHLKKAFFLAPAQAKMVKRVLP